jgi:4-carboxymuconolactone decarboxylase
MSEDITRHEAGMEVRRQVLGDDHVDAVTAATNDLDRDFQSWITESVWGSLWTRPGLERRERSLITIGLLAADSHEELALHLRAARNTGVKPEDIVEVLLHVAIYAGVPAANHAFKIMKQIYGEEEE